MKIEYRKLTVHPTEKPYTARFINIYSDEEDIRISLYDKHEHLLADIVFDPEQAYALAKKLESAVDHALGI